MHSRLSRKVVLGTGALAALAIAGCSDQTGPMPSARRSPGIPVVSFAQAGNMIGNGSDSSDWLGDVIS